jgi:hypothetical protein
METSDKFMEVEKIAEQFMKEIATLLNSEKYSSLNVSDPVLTNPSFLLSEKSKPFVDPNQVKFSIICDFDNKLQRYVNHRVQKTVTINKVL